MAVPYTFGSATTSIPLSQLDSNFATTITLGNTAIQLGNTVTTLNNMTLANVTISSGTSNLATTAITNGTSNVTIASSGGNISMATNGTTAVTIDTSQNVGIGTASPSYRIDAVGTGTASTGILRTSSNLTNSTIKYGYYTVGHYTNATAPFGFIQGESNSTENNVHIGGGAGEVTAATRIDFYTAANNSTTSGTERMRIDSSGVVMVGKTTSNNTSNGFQLQASGQELSVNRNLDRCGLFGRNGNDGDIIIFLRDGTTKGSVSVSGANVSYNTSSDYRLKENIAPMDGALAKVAQLKPVTY